MNIRPYINRIVGFLLLAVAVILWAMPSNPQNPPRPADALRVVLDKVQINNRPRIARFAGVTQAKNRATLSFAVPARVIERPAASGDRVSRGQILARLDDREYTNAVTLAKASADELKTRWEQARRDRSRIEQLASSNVATVSALEKAVTGEHALAASYQAAVARFEEARRMLGETILRAPFSGTVTRLSVQPGEWAVPGQPAIELTGDGDLELLVEVPESIMTRLTAGRQVPVRLPFAGDRTVPGRVSTVARAAISAGRLFPVTVDLAAETGLHPGLTAELMLDLASEDALTVPLAAVVNPGASEPAIFIYDQGRVHRKPVSLGPIIDDRIVVRGAIAEGDQVVTSGQSQLADGDEVEAAI